MIGHQTFHDLLTRAGINEVISPSPSVFSIWEAIYNALRQNTPAPIFWGLRSDNELQFVAVISPCWGSMSVANLHHVFRDLLIRSRYCEFVMSRSRSSCSEPLIRVAC